MPDVSFLCPDLPPDAEAEFKKLIPSDLERAAEYMREIAMAISFSAADFRKFEKGKQMTEDQQKIFDEINRSFEEYVRETCGSEFVEGVKKMPPEVSNCVKELLSCKVMFPAAYGCEIKDAGDGTVNIIIYEKGNDK